MPEAQHTPESTEPASDQPVSQKVTTERRIDPSIIRDPLRRLRAKARLLLVVQRIALIGATLLAGLALFTLIDFVLRFPTALRATVLIIAIGVLFWFVRTRIRPAFRFAPRLTDLALRVEQRYPSMQGRLASALEFADWTPESGSKASAMVGDTGRGLARIVVERTAADMNQVRPSELIKPAGAKRSAGAFGLVLALLIAAFVVSPTMFATGASRTLAPWSGAEWPKRTGVADATDVEVHPIGRALPMRAVLTKSPRPADRTDVLVQYRLTTEGETGPIRRELLTHQSRDLTLDDGSSGALFERLLEPVADRIEYRFSTDDDTTPWRRVRLVPAPAVAGASVTITPPDYAASINASDAESDEAQVAQTRTLDLGPGTDARAVAPAALVGSRVELELRFNKPANVVGQLAQLLVATDDLAIEPSLDEPSDSYTARFTLRDSFRLQLDLIDTDDIGSDDTAVYRFDALADRPAASTIVEPATDRSVLPSAVLTVRAEGRDDVGLASIAIEQQRYAPAGAPGSEPSGPGGALEPVGEAAVAVSREAEGRRLVTTEYELDLSTIEGLSPGDELRLTALALDVLSASLPEAIPSRSPERTLRIISEEQFVAEVRDSLSAVREAAIRTDEQQENVTERTQTDGASRATRREQAAVTQRLAQARRDVEDLQDRIESNRLDDRTLEDLLSRVSDALDRAGNASTQASETLDEAGARADRQDEPADPENPDAAPLTEEEQAEAQQAQEEVRDELSNVVGLLDRGEDDWLIRNTLDRLIDQQRELQERTGQAGQDAAGLRPEELSDEQRERLEEISREQQELAEQADELIEQMRERAQELSETDPAGAEALQQAAQNAQQNQVPENMEQAASEAQQNQTQQAQQAQQEAIEALEEAREDLDESDQARAEILRRVLASVIESLEGLIGDQTDAIASLDAVAAQEPLDPQTVLDLAPAMIRLNTNTAAVADLVRGSGPELAPVLNLVQRAVDAQVDAIVEIRSGDDDTDAIRAAESRSLDQLKQALERAEALDRQLEQEEQERKKRELRQAYLDALRATTELRAKTEPYADAAELTRRDRAELRRLSSEQSAITQQLAEILELVEELREASVFMLAHNRAESLSENAAERLTDAEPATALARQQSLAQTLTRILEALEDPEPDDQPFEDGAQAGGGGGGGGGGGQDEPLIAPVQELRLLRMIQIELAEATASVQGMPEAEARREIARLASEQRELTKVAVDLLKRAEAAQNLDELFPDDTRIEGGEPGEPGDPAPTQPEGPQP
jgi:hypothetical protein